MTRTTHGQDPAKPTPTPANEMLESALIGDWLRVINSMVGVFESSLKVVTEESKTWHLLMSMLPIAVSRFQLHPDCEQHVTIAPPSPRPRL